MGVLHAQRKMPISQVLTLLQLVMIRVWQCSVMPALFLDCFQVYQRTAMLALAR